MLINFGDNLLASGAFAVSIGVLLGAFYFIGLWWTVRRLNSSRNVAPLFLLSLLFRIGVVVAGFYAFLSNDWRQLLLGLFGFIVMRVFVTRFIKSKDDAALIAPAFIRNNKVSQAGEQE